MNWKVYSVSISDLLMYIGAINYTEFKNFIFVRKLYLTLNVFNDLVCYFLLESNVPQAFYIINQLHTSIAISFPIIFA